jgi:pantoate--beta-alanine ligase
VSAQPLVVTGIAGIRAAVASARTAASRVALVPTMGALHDGHLALVARAQELAEVVVVSIFVNPLQFGPGEDLEQYPRTLREDVSRLAALGVQCVFAPAVEELYPTGYAETRVTAGRVGALYEGATRPGHFDGVLTVVAKLLNIVRPDYALFGQKDAQQVFLVRRMAADLDIPVAIEVVPIVREPGGLAMSSRNRYLSAEERRAALTLSQALAAAAASAHLGLEGAREAARVVLAAEPGVRLDYLVLVRPETFLPLGEGDRGPALALLAAYVGTTRLIDNRPLTLG